jgi:hypothetical protein
MPLLHVLTAGRTTSIRPRGRTDVAVALDQGLAWITHSASSSRFLVPAAQVVRASSRLPTVGTFALRLTQDQVATL